MDLETRKLNAIGFLLGLQDESILSKIETAISELKTLANAATNTSPFTKEEMIERAKIANQDYLLGRYKTQEQLEQESENW